MIAQDLREQPYDDMVDLLDYATDHMNKIRGLLSPSMNIAQKTEVASRIRRVVDRMKELARAVEEA